MDVKKCNRCGTYYDEIIRCEVSGEYVTGVATTIGQYLKGFHREYDLCDDCRRPFYNWLAMK